MAHPDTDLAAATSDRGAASPGFMMRLAPLLLLLLLVALSLLLWRGQIEHRRALLSQLMDTVADQAVIRLLDFFQTRLADMAVLAAHIAEHDGGEADSTHFAMLASAYYQSQPGFQAINWIDQDGVVRVVVPLALNPGVLGFNIEQHPVPAVRQTIARARADTGPAVTPCVTLLQGGEGIASYWPVRVRGRLHGFVNGVFRVAESVNAALAEGVLERFDIALVESGRVIFHEGQGALPAEPRWSARRRIEMPSGLSWTLVLVPQPEVVERYSAANATPFLLFTLLVSAGLAGLAQQLTRVAAAMQRARDKAMRELAQRQRLEVELRRTIADLELANRAKEQINTELDAYIYAASHDVRAPLVAVGGLVDILLEPDGTLDADERQHIIGRIRHNVGKLDALVQDMLMVSRSRRLERTSEPVDIEAVCQEVWSSLSALVGDLPAELTLIVPAREQFRTDPLRFRQIVNNLLSNALKYRDPAKPRLEVVVEARLEEGDGAPRRLELTVRDNGQGVPHACLPRIFDMFYKASDESFGSGLGLYIVRQHARSLGGEVACVPLPGGTEFRVTLPVDEAAPLAPPAPPVPPAPRAAPR